jgi:hypothetical protein
MGPHSARADGGLLAGRRPTPDDGAVPTGNSIDEAISSGKQVRAVDKADGNRATTYIHPTTRQSVVVDDLTGEVIYVGGRDSDTG